MPPNTAAAGAVTASLSHLQKGDNPLDGPFATRLTIGQAPAATISCRCWVCLSLAEHEARRFAGQPGCGQIAERYAPQRGDKLLVSRLLTGTQVTLCARSRRKRVAAEDPRAGGGGMPGNSLLSTWRNSADCWEQALFWSRIELSRVDSPISANTASASWCRWRNRLGSRRVNGGSWRRRRTMPSQSHLADDAAS